MLPTPIQDRLGHTHCHYPLQQGSIRPCSPLLSKTQVRPEMWCIRTAREAALLGAYHARPTLHRRLRAQLENDKFVWPSALACPLTCLRNVHADVANGSLLEKRQESIAFRGFPGLKCACSSKPHHGATNNTQARWKSKFQRTMRKKKLT